MDTEATLARIQRDIEDRFQRSDRVLAFGEFLGEFVKDPYLYLRTSPQYLLEMFDSLGTDESRRVGRGARRFRVFDAQDSTEFHCLVGQEAVQEEIYRNIRSFAKRGKADKMLLLHGPNGSGKTTVVDCVMQALESFSRTPRGRLLSFNWVFTERDEKLERIGFESGNAVETSDSYAHLDEKDISARIPCELRDSPIFLIPRDVRAELVEEVLRGRKPPREDFPEEAFTTPYLEGDLCQKCKRIYDSLLVAYHGDWRKVVRHAQIERFYISKRYRVGAVSIEPQGNVDATARSIHGENSWNIPPVLKNISLFIPLGDIVDANRGVLEYSDFLKRPLEASKYLLTTCERGTVNLPNCVAYLDVSILATANEKQVSLFKRNPDFSSFKGRMELIPVPYLLRVRTEEELYGRQVQSFSRGRHVTPHAVRVGALWAVLTRLRKPDPERYSGPLASAVAKLTPLEKAALYDTSEAPHRFTDEERKLLRSNVITLRNEFEEDEREFEGVFGAEYEGRRGVSPREMVTAFSRAAEARTYACLTPMAVFDTLDQLVRDASLYDFLRLPEDNGYHDVVKLLADVRGEYLRWVTDEVYDSIELIDESEYDRVFLEYFRHVKAFDAKEQVYNHTANTYGPPNEEFMESIERLVEFSEPVEEFRSGIMTRIAAWSLDHRQEKIDYHTLFADIYKALRDNFYRERNRVLTLIEQDIVKYGTDEFDLLSKSEQETVRSALASMKNKYGYCDHCSRDVLAYALKCRADLPGDG